MKIANIILIISILALTSCSQVRESAGVTRKSINELDVVENPMLIIPPEFNLLAPDQLKEKNIDSLEKDLAQEILFGLDQDVKVQNNQLSTMSNILKKSNAINTSPAIREEIDKNFANEIDTKSIFSMEWENEIEVLDAVKESERIRNKNFEGKKIGGDKIPTKIKIIKNKKKKRFILF